MWNTVFVLLDTAPKQMWMNWMKMLGLLASFFFLPRVRRRHKEAGSMHTDETLRRSAAPCRAPTHTLHHSWKSKAELCNSLFIWLSGLMWVDGFMEIWNAKANIVSGLHILILNTRNSWCSRLPCAIIYIYIFFLKGFSLYCMWLLCSLLEK